MDGKKGSMRRSSSLKLPVNTDGAESTTSAEDLMETQQAPSDDPVWQAPSAAGPKVTFPEEGSDPMQRGVKQSAPRLRRGESGTAAMSSSSGEQEPPTRPTKPVFRSQMFTPTAAAVPHPPFSRDAFSSEAPVGRGRGSRMVSVSGVLTPRGGAAEGGLGSRIGPSGPLGPAGRGGGGSGMGGGVEDRGGSRYMSQTLQMCMDPLCNTCPPEMHIMRNQRMIQGRANRLAHHSSEDGSSFVQRTGLIRRNVGGGGGEGKAKGGVTDSWTMEMNVVDGLHKKEGGGGGEGGEGETALDEQPEFPDLGDLGRYGFDLEEDSEISPSEMMEGDEEGEVVTVVRCFGFTCCTFRKNPEGQPNFLHRLLDTLAWAFQPSAIINPNSNFYRTWSKVFLFVSILGYALDPLFFFLLYIVWTKGPQPWSPTSQSGACVSMNYTWAIIFSILRFMVDICYSMRIIIQLRTAFKVPPKPSPSIWLYFTHGWWRPADEQKVGELEFDPREVRRHYLQTWFITDVLCAIPIPQILMLFVVPFAVPPGPHQVDIMIQLLCIPLLLQIVPRSIRLFPLLSGGSSAGFVLETAWGNFALNFVLYLMASHVVGATWYLFTVQQVSKCLTNICNSPDLSIPVNQCYDDIICLHEESNEPVWAPSSSINFCLQANGTLEDSLFASALAIVSGSQGIVPYLYSFFWGLQQVSTLLGNLTPSTYIPEILFAITITSLGLLLLSLLIGNISNFLQALSRRAFEHQLHSREVEIWMQRNHLPPILQKRVHALHRLNWTVRQGLDEDEVYSKLSEDLQRDVRRSLLADLKRTSVLFSAMEPIVFDAFCERLHHRLYIAGTDITREGYPVSRLFFITRGTLESFSTYGGRTGMMDSVILNKGDIVGEELLVDALEKMSPSSSSSGGGGGSSRRKLRPVHSLRSTSGHSFPHAAADDVLPYSSRTVRCIGPVEGFSLNAEDVQFVCRQFARSLSSVAVQVALNQISQTRRGHAAITIQLAFRRYLRRKHGLTIEQAMSAQKKGRIAALFKDRPEDAQRLQDKVG